MRKSRFTDAQIIGVIKEHDAGVAVKDLCRKHGISPNTFYKWKSKFGGMDVSDVAKMRTLRDENGRLNRSFIWRIPVKHERLPSIALSKTCTKPPHDRRLDLSAGVATIFWD